MSEERPIRVTVWGENRAREADPEVPRSIPTACTRRSPRDPRAPRRARGGSDGDARRPGARPRPRGARADRRADLVGPHLPRRRRDDVATASSSACSTGWASSSCTPAHFSKIFKRLMGTSCNLRWREARRPRARLDGRTRRTRRRRACRPDRDRAPGDVRRVLRHPAARRARVHQLVHRRRGVPQRLLLPPRARAGSSTSARATRTTRSTTTPRPAGNRECRALGSR